jgi:uncharacterized membrane protein HdeD (DUF308 family)
MQCIALNISNGIFIVLASTARVTEARPHDDSGGEWAWHSLLGIISVAGGIVEWVNPRCGGLYFTLVGQPLV